MGNWGERKGHKPGSWLRGMLKVLLALVACDKTREPVWKVVVQDMQIQKQAKRSSKQAYTYFQQP